MSIYIGDKRIKGIVGQTAWGNIPGNIQNQTDLIELLRTITPLWGKITGTLSNQEDLANALGGKVNLSDIINNTTTTATNKPLSANAGKILQDQINNLLGRGKYLSLWNCATGLAMTTPPVDPYTYETGSFFIVGNVGTGTKYKPSGSTYSSSSPSTAVEPDEVSINDTYYYDGTTWHLLHIDIPTISFGSLAGLPSDNVELANVLNSLRVPVGVVQAYTGITAPNGWLLCDGRAISRTTYAELFAVVGTRFGNGDGSTTFNVPNLTDKFIEGGTVGTVKEAGLPNITGSFYGDMVSRDVDVTATGAFNFGGGTGHFGTSTTYNLINGFTFDASRSNPIYGNSSTVQPPAVCMSFIIKY